MNYSYTMSFSNSNEREALRDFLLRYAFQLDQSLQQSRLTQQSLCGESPPQEKPAPVRLHKKRKRTVLSPQTERLLEEFKKMPNQLLSKEDVRQDVLFDSDARDESVRQCIVQARKEFKSGKLPYSIETITGRGYRLISREKNE